MRWPRTSRHPRPHYRSTRFRRTRRQGKGPHHQTLSGGMKRRLTLARAINVRISSARRTDHREARPAGAPPDLGPPQTIDGARRPADPDHALHGRGRAILCDRLAILDHGRLITEARHDLIAHRTAGRGDFRRRGNRMGARAPRTRCTHRSRRRDRLFYCQDVAPLLAALKDNNSLRFLHRCATLEDLFIKLTGRELRDRYELGNLFASRPGMRWLPCGGAQD